MSLNFAVTGVAGYVAPRHLQAIQDTGNRLVAAADPNDSVGILDRFGFDVKFFREIERFDRHLDKCRRGPESERISWVSVCSPNFLHDAHIRLALRNGANALCEKPLVINPWNLDALEQLEKETDRRVFTVLQLRVHAQLVALRDRLRAESTGGRRQVVLTYVTSRGGWYHVSWKGQEERSGGVATNIGIHLFDLLIWLFGAVQRSTVHLREPKKTSGFVELEGADVRWFLSVDPADLPFTPKPGRVTSHRSILVDGSEIEFTEGFTDLHTKTYERTLAGQGFGIADARRSIELAYQIRTAPIAAVDPETAHPKLLAEKHP